MPSVKDNMIARWKQNKTVRKKTRGPPEMPRFTVFKSAKHIYAQIIDDTTGCTLVAASTVSKELRP
ncbi:MAG: 50S ribosomal protein L18, partial [Deltaproteobacteria bacterium]